MSALDDVIEFAKKQRFDTGVHSAEQAAAELAILVRDSMAYINAQAEIADAHNELTAAGVGSGTLPERIAALRLQLTHYEIGAEMQIEEEKGS